MPAPAPSSSFAFFLFALADSSSTTSQATAHCDGSSRFSHIVCCDEKPKIVFGCGRGVARESLLAGGNKRKKDDVRNAVSHRLRHYTKTENTKTHEREGETTYDGDVNRLPNRVGESTFRSVVARHLLLGLFQQLLELGALLKRPLWRLAIAEQKLAAF